MKRVFLILLMQCSLFAFGQEKENWKNMSFKEAAFTKTLNMKDKISQMETAGNKKRELLPYQMNTDDILKLYLLNCYDEKGYVEESQYIISKQGIPNDFDLFLIPLNSANVLYFDGLFLDSKYKDKTNIAGHTIVKVQDKEVDMNNSMANYAAVCDNGGIQICEHWYFIITEDDILVYVDDLGEICIQCSGGGGGGGSQPPNNNENCDQRTQEFANQGSAMSGSIDASGGTVEGDTWNIPYNWSIYTAGTWGLFSYEKAKLLKVRYANKSIWEYQTFDHEHIAEVGGVFGGTRTFQDILATTNMTDSKTRVDLRIDFSVTSTPTLPASVQYLCTPLTLLYNSSKKFYAPNSFIIVN